jgi:diguanylate cyclase (GGDEF)-like protein/PAS domain S-box-containing protein
LNSVIRSNFIANFASLPDWIRWLLVWFVVAVSYTLAAKASLAMSLADGPVLVIWLPAGVGLAGFWLFGWRVAPAIMVAAWLDAFSSTSSILVATMVALGNTMAGAVAGLWLARVLLRRPPTWAGPWVRKTQQAELLPQDSRALLALVVASIATSLMSALPGISILIFTGTEPSSRAQVLLASWWIGGVTGTLLVAPLAVLLFCLRVWRQFGLEHLLAWACAGAVSAGLFFYVNMLPGGKLPWLFLILPFAIWAGLRLGIGGTIIMVAVVTVPALLGSLSQPAEVLQLDQVARLAQIQLGMIMFSLTGLLLACATQARHSLAQQLQAQELRNRTLVDLFTTGPVVAISWSAEFGMPPRFVSSNIEQLLGISHLDLVQPEFRCAEIIHPDDFTRIALEVSTHLAARTIAYEQRYRVRHNDGHWVHVRDQTRVVYPEDGGPVDKRSYLTDCTAEVNAQHDHAKLLQALDQSPESILITDVDSRIEYVNEAFCTVTGFSANELMGRTPRLLASGKTPEQDYASLKLSLFAGLAWEGELINRRKNLQEFPARVRISPVRNFLGETTQYLMLMQDVSEIKTAQQKMNSLANFDGLTGLANRAFMQSELGSALDECARSGKTMALVVLNVDRFKFINDAQGNAVGDELLQQLARALLDLQPAVNLVARLGGDEFGLLMSAGHVDATSLNHAALSLSESLRACAGDGFLIAGRRRPITLSFGVASFGLQSDETAAVILDRAQTALHRAKERGGNTLSFFDTAMGAAARQSFALEHELREGIEREELRVYLQSQVNAAGETVGSEALVRWQHPVRGLLAPGLFIGMAEETDLIVKLEEWVFMKVLTLMADLEAQALPLNVSVNLSTRHFRQVGFVSWLRDLLKRTGAEPSRLTLEITESIAMEDVHEVIAKMDALSRLGVHFALDDFGTGYSSLSYLKRLPISELKIDKTFVQDAPDNPDDGALVETILSVAKIMHLKVVAEGVETLAQAEFLTSRSEVVLQGYLYGRPMPADDWLTQWKSRKSLI